MTDDTQPEALRLANVCSNLTRYSMDAHLIAAELCRQHARIAELEAELEAVGAGGVNGPLMGQPQAMPDLTALTEHGAKAWAASAMAGEPMAWMTFTEEGDPDMVFLDRLEACQYCEDDDPPKPLYLAAPPTAQAEGWTRLPEALRLAEQYDHGDPAAHGNAWKAAVCTELRRLAELEAQIEALSGVQALSAAPGPVSDTQHSQFLSDVLTAAGLITHGKRCKALGERLSDMVMRLRAAPQQEAQGPVAWLNPWRADQVTTDYDAYGERGIPLYAAPQPAPAPLREREAFERDWEKRHAPVPINGRTHDDGRYGDSSIQDAWESWQARAALAAVIAFLNKDTP